MSAIDWLSDSIGASTLPALLPDPEPAATSTDPNVDQGADTALTGPPSATALTQGVGGAGAIAVSILGPASPEATGLFAAQDANLAPGFWGRVPRDEAMALIATQRSFPLPALGDLFRAILLAELTPPDGSDQAPLLFLARIDRLLAMGALEEAAALVNQAPPEVAARPEVFRRAFDAALLLGTENDGCTRIERAPELAPTLPVRIFCFVRLDDWQAAQLTLDIAQMLGQVAPDEGDLLARFLDPTIVEENGPLLLPPDQTITPLLWRMLEATGEPVPTETLPLAFAHADLGPNTGWRSRILAAERLARGGVIAPEVLFSLYTQGRPAASGGVWDRATVITELETALAGGDTDALAQILPTAWDAFQAAELEVAFATQYARELAGRLPPDDPAARLAFRIGMLGPDWQDHAIRSPVQPEAQDRFVQALVMGDPAAALTPDATTRAIALAFRSPAPAALLTPDQRSALRNGRATVALFEAMDRLAAAAAGDLRGLVDALAFLRVVGFDDIARHVAVQLVLLDRRG